MPRTLTINAARLVRPPTTTFDPGTLTGLLTAMYMVGHWDGSVFTVYRGAENSDTMKVQLGPSDTPAETLQKLCGGIAQQEGLDLSAGDQVLLP